MPDAENRWLAETGGTRGPQYAERFRKLAASGADVHGEARAIDALVRSVTGAGVGGVLDAGCGTGRVALELARRGHRVTGVDLDASMVAEARRAAADEGLDVRLEQGDLLDLSVAKDRQGTYDVVAAPGNVLVYLTPGTEADVVAALSTAVGPGGLVVAGFTLARHVSVAGYESWCSASGLELVHRWATWDGAPYTVGGDYVVSVHRR